MSQESLVAVIAQPQIGSVDDARYEGTDEVRCAAGDRLDETLRGQLAKFLDPGRIEAIDRREAIARDRDAHREATALRGAQQRPVAALDDAWPLLAVGRGKH